ncbi:nickel pincer cofactor biosynthesis protein LarC [Rhodopirellula sp. MGV]|uniref:nickel pincer cofactor biosynthesis protein LarC n=1 Tax=Rhodopirellula sp. MGV TaxID=2023130 RepID=UPI000B97A3E0|nr:nickel pincer cofactor biosynthesis protein LarC [Rhodopirellula sp. MGV]OYP32308.1 TIGR00299 family protein [Rhodopirellula sp. MGV]PNY35907.1 nickel pincer cofactor biosynthesis protein LarC [Rhodopirellula baltica]
MTKTAYFDCLSGISGDMTLAALIDLGASVEQIESSLRSMGLPDLSLTAQDVKKCGFRSKSITIGHPPQKAHRHLHHIHDMIDGAGEIDAEAKSLAKRIFGHVAVAEAKVHGTTLQKVHFHEVGAIDSIADIVGVSIAITSLGIRSALASPVPTGTGTITIDHGTVSVPAPATAEILRGIPIASSTIARELTTPTGAAILKELCVGFGPVPDMTIEAIGYGAGTMDLDGQPNILRVLVGECGTQPSLQTHQSLQHDHVVVLETNLDDATGEQIANCSQRLLQAGALDVTQTACTMKKGRSGILLSVIAQPDRLGLMEELIFRHTSAIGVRRRIAERDILPRRNVSIETPLGRIAAKVVRLPNGDERMKVESDDAYRLAEENGLTCQDIRQIAEQSFSGS